MGVCSLVRAADVVAMRRIGNLAAGKDAPGVGGEQLREQLQNLKLGAGKPQRRSVDEELP